MKLTKKKGFLLLLILMVIVLAVYIVMNVEVKKDTVEEKQEIVPEEEISDEQLRETTIKLYYVNANNEIAEELSKIDAKLLITNPYMEVLKLLIDKTKNEGLKTAIPSGVKINDVKINKDTVTIDFSKEFIENMPDDEKLQKLAINQLVRTLTQFKEVNGIKIVVDGKENLQFRDGNINFATTFTKEGIQDRN